MAAKAGLLTKLGGLLMAFKEVIVIAFLALAGMSTKVFKRRKAEPQMQ